MLGGSSDRQNFRRTTRLMSTIERGDLPPTTPGERLRSARINAGYEKQASFVRKFNLTQSTYALHEGGKRNFDNETAQVYANALGLTAEYLQFGSTPDKAVTSERADWLDPAAELNAGRWIVSDTSPRVHANAHYRVPADSRYPADIQKAYILAGSSGGAFLPPGSVVVALTVCDNPLTLPMESLVVVKRFHDRGRSMELSLRRVAWTARGKVRLTLPFPDDSLDEESSADLTIDADRPSKAIKLIGRVVSHHTFY